MSSFPCSLCGMCCKRVNIAIEHYKLLEPEFIFPFKVIEGVCSKLEDNKCSVYEDRPILCNVDRLSEKWGIEKGYFYEVNKTVCNILMDENNIDLKFRIQ